MKTRIILSLILISALTAFMFTKPDGAINTFSPAPTNNNLDDRFLIGAMNTMNDGGNGYVHYDSIGFNLWQTYLGGMEEISGRKYPKGITYWDADDKLFSNIVDYAPAIRDSINTVHSHNNSRLVLSRPKIEWLCYGQRSDYQCESSNIDPDLWFYSFNDHNTGITDTDSGQTVVHCRAGGSGPNHDDSGFVVKRLKANTEQCRVISTNEGNVWQGDSECDWLIKPRIRIDSAFANNPQNSGTLVCRIDVRNQDNNLIKSITESTKFLLQSPFFPTPEIHSHSQS